MQLSSYSDMLYATQHYRREMESIWELVNQLPEGQDKVVMSQLWHFGKTPASPTPEEFPALVAHGFIVEQLADGKLVWRPNPPSLKEFWRVGITVSNAHGYLLQPQRAFQVNLQADIYLHSSVQSWAEPLPQQWIVATSKTEHSPRDLDTKKVTVKLVA